MKTQKMDDRSCDLSQNNSIRLEGASEAMGYDTRPFSRSSKNKFTMRNALKSAQSTNQGMSERETISEAKLQREIETLEKQAKRREAEFSKIKAVLEQKLELKDLQLADIKDNMEKQKEMYNSMLKALQNKSENLTYEKQLQSIQEMQRKQDSEVQKIRTKYEKQITDLKERINLQEFNEKSLKDQLKQEKNNHQHELQEKEKEISEIDLKMQKTVLEKDKICEKLREQIENMEEKHLRFIKDMEGNTNYDVERLTLDYQSKLSDVKYLKDQEILSLKSQIRKLEEEIMVLREQDRSFESIRSSEYATGKGKSSSFGTRLSQLNEKFADDMLATEKEVASLRRENSEKKSTIDTLHLSIEKIKDQYGTRLEEREQKYSKLKRKYSDKCDELSKAQKIIKDSLNLKKRISDLKMTNAKLERTKRDLKDALKNKQNELEAEKAFKQKAIYEERRKNKEKNEKMSQMKREMNLQNLEIEGLKRDHRNGSMVNDSKIHSPCRLRRKRSHEKSFLAIDPETAATTKRNLDSSQYMNDSTAYSKNTRRLKSSSPSRTQLLFAASKIKVEELGKTGNSKKRMPMSDEKTNTYDDSHLHCHAAGKYCEACKYKKWRILQLNYDPDKLMNNRDMIKYIVCLGCSKSLEVKPFLKHCRDCRLSNHVPNIDGQKYWKKGELNSSSRGASERSRNRISSSKSKLRQCYSTKGIKEEVISPTTEDSRLGNCRSQSKLKVPESSKDKPKVVLCDLADEMAEFHTRSQTKHKVRTSKGNSTMMLKNSSPVETLEDAEHDRSFNYKVYGTIPKGVSKTEAQILREEISNMKSDYAQVMNKMNQMNRKQEKRTKCKREIDNALKKELHKLHSRLEPVDFPLFELELEEKSHLVTGNFDYLESISEAKRLSDSMNSSSGHFTREGSGNMKYR
ncbi:unnamed protein product [Moneuplotes crassus]|uniref:Uncharacterized protein n=1 Tax=Euplotes crassus TaxID=5936 RepID=A0AAD1Y0V9_EUPCR|nr:unnamed protein product [Moneuplotes crassus]